VKPVFRAALATAVVLTATLGVASAQAEKSGGVLRMPMITSPASMSIHEESTIAALGPMMGVFKIWSCSTSTSRRTVLESIVPDLAVSGV
jgi:hypothetical protein